MAANHNVPEWKRSNSTLPLRDESVNRRRLGISGFTDLKDIGHFRCFQWKNGMTPIQSRPASEPFIPTPLIPRSKWNSLNGTNLGQGFPGATEREESDSGSIPMQTFKHQVYFKWMVDNDFFGKIKRGEFSRPDFISSEGRIVESLLTPVKKEKQWEVFAVRYNDIIFISSGGKTESRNNSVQSHAGDMFLKLLAGKNPPLSPLNHWEIPFAVTETQLGEHKLLLLVAGKERIEGEDKIVKVRACDPSQYTKRNEAMRKKFLDYWGRIVVSGSDGLLLGLRETCNDSRVPIQRLENIEELTPEEVWNKARAFPNSIPGRAEIDEREQCFSFLHRMLDWVKGEMTENSLETVKVFRWDGKRLDCEQDSWRTPRQNVVENVTCYLVSDREKAKEIVDFVIPPWFIERVEER